MNTIALTYSIHHLWNSLNNNNRLEYLSVANENEKRKKFDATKVSYPKQTRMPIMLQTCYRMSMLDKIKGNKTITQWPTIELGFSYEIKQRN